MAKKKTSKKKTAKKKTSGQKMLAEEDVIEAQGRWAEAIVKIGNAYTTGQDVVEIARDRIDTLYGYGNDGYGDGNPVLFKPTKCEERQFRLGIDGALSYFVGQKLSESTFFEDKGFALAPYVAVKFLNADIIVEESRAIAMGNYFFTSAAGTTIKVEYTFGYRLRGGDLVIDVHHSSLPFSNA